MAAEAAAARRALARRRTCFESERQAVDCEFVPQAVACEFMLQAVARDFMLQAVAFEFRSQVQRSLQALTVELPSGAAPPPP
jgi:hypothetical protein